MEDAMVAVVTDQPILEDWYIWKRPFHGFLCLHGTVTGHPREDLNGHEVDTSRLLQFSMEDRVARTKSRLYRLGTPHPVFLEKLQSSDYAYREEIEKMGPVILLEGEKIQ